MADTAVRASSSNSAATGTALSVTAPAGTTTGDLVIVICHANGQTTLIDNNGSTPFAADLSNFQPNTTSGMTVSVFSRRIQAGDPGTYNFTSGATDRWGVVAITLSSPDPSAIYDVAIGTANTDAPPQATIATIPSVTTLTDKDVHLAVGCADGAGTPLTSDPAGYTPQQSTSNQGIRVASKVITPAGATGSLTMNCTAADAVIGLSIAIKNNTPVSGVVSSTVGPFHGGGPGIGPRMRRMFPQQFPAPGQIDAVTSAAQIQPLRARGLGIGPRLRRTFPQQFPQAGIATVTAKVGPYTWAGAASSLAVLIGAHVGAWTWTGKSSSLSTEVPGKVGAYTWAGKQASLATEIRSTVGAYTWAGKTASLAASLVSRVGAYTWSGVKSAVPKQITETVGAYTWAGRSATFGSTVTFSSTVGAYAWSGITAPVLRFVSSATGAYSWTGSAAIVASGAAPVSVERFSGGWEYARRARKRLEEELRTEREQWGILPKAAQIVSAVAIRQADALGLNAEQRLEELERELELAGVRYQAQYLELLNLQRQRLIDAEIKGYFEAQEALNEENARRLLLLLAFL